MGSARPRPGPSRWAKTNSNMSPPGAYSITIARWRGVRNTSRKRMMWGWAAHRRWLSTSRRVERETQGPRLQKFDGHRRVGGPVQGEVDKAKGALRGVVGVWVWVGGAGCGGSLSRLSLCATTAASRRAVENLGPSFSCALAPLSPAPFPPFHPCALHAAIVGTGQQPGRGGRGEVGAHQPTHSEPTTTPPRVFFFFFSL